VPPNFERIGWNWEALSCGQGTRGAPSWSWSCFKHDLAQDELHMWMSQQKDKNLGPAVLWDPVTANLLVPVPGSLAAYMRHLVVQCGYCCHIGRLQQNRQQGQPAPRKTSSWTIGSIINQSTNQPVNDTP
jgi:hypothetical protein